MEQPLVSIGMPCYDRPAMLRQAIESIINQTYQNLEIIISDDCSPNQEVVRIVDEYAAKDKRIRAYHQTTDLKCYGNYFFVLNAAKGKYFMYAQDDDRWTPDLIEECVVALEANPGAAVAIPRSEYMVDGKTWQQFTFEKQNLVSFIFGEKIPFVWMSVFRLDRLKEFDNTGRGDHGWDIVICAGVVLSYPYVYVPKPLYSKTLYHDKAKEYIDASPLCHFEMYYHMLEQIIRNPNVKKKWMVLVLAPASLFALVRMYSAYLLFQLPVDHPVRKTVRRLIS